MTVTFRSPLPATSARPRGPWIRRTRVVLVEPAPQPDGHDTPQDLGGDNDPVMDIPKPSRKHWTEI